MEKTLRQLKTEYEKKLKKKKDGVEAWFLKHKKMFMVTNLIVSKSNKGSS